jgi:predicted AAA+ superfamily ATPase
VAVNSADVPLIERRLMPIVGQRLDTFPVVVLTGPRTVGKSTLLRAIAAQTASPIIDLDDLGVRAAVAQDPALYASGFGPVVIDEFRAGTCWRVRPAMTLCRSRPRR